MAALRSSGFILPLKSTSMPAFVRIRVHSSPTSSAIRTFGMALVRPLEVLGFPGVDADVLALFDEGRHLDDRAGLEGGGLVDVGDGRALQGGLGLRHLEGDGK